METYGVVCVEPCKWHADGVTITIGGGLPKSISWSPSGTVLAITMHVEGIWLLDLHRYSVVMLPLDPRCWWFRPVWSDDDTLLLSSPNGGILLEFADGTWTQKTETYHGWVRWAEHIPGAGHVGIQLDAEPGATIVYSEDAFAPVHTVCPVLPDGTRLSVWGSEYPAWWVPGESILVVALLDGGMRTFRTELSSGVSEPWLPDVSLPEGTSHCFTRTACAAYLGVLHSREMIWSGRLREDRLLVLDINAGTARDLGLVPVRHIEHSIAMSPTGDHIALIDDIDSLSIIQLAK